MDNFFLYPMLLIFFTSKNCANKRFKFVCHPQKFQSMVQFGLKKQIKYTFFFLSKHAVF